ncbi:TonB-dependent receptor [Stenotrophomonas sp. PS02298]|uniref:TonB-dependent receptor n=1 Tax=Stenotrophomonas sp. PS02298 TaxID=2991424 RepID=UPI00249C1864|nr:TonB-dependent receptor [Stenotrophomonas sp. PS02298]
MNHPRIKMSKLALGLVVALAAAPAFAQSTSAGVGGQVTNVGGQPVAGAEVTITHTESGTVSRAVTDDSGRYSARGLRVGGPYTITITKPGEGTKTEEGVYLNLNQVGAINAQLGGDVTTMAGVAVTASRLMDTFNPDNKGVGTSISGRQLDLTPKGNRSLDDVARLDPRITVTDQGTGAISVAGVNNRYNNISVDGLSQGDPFGLNANGMPYAGSPISVDTIAAYDLKVSDYDVGSDTVGATVNAVTKSGTNEFHGSVYYAYKNADDMVGSRNGQNYGGFDKDATKGVTLGGPIVKDKLFFFASYEEQEVTNFGGSSNADGYENGVISMDEINQVIDIAKNKYGFDAGTYGAFGVNLDSKRYLAKIDWNINDSHRLSLTHQRTEEFLPQPYDANSNSVILSSRWYNKDNLTKNTSLQLFSDWSPNFSTEAKVSYQTFDQINGNPLNLPTINITTANNTTLGNGIRLGEDRNRHENQINTEKLTATVFANWYLNDHTLKFGVDYMRNDVFNLYGRDLHGVYTFASIADFEAGQYDSYNVRQPIGQYGVNDTAAAMVYTQVSPFVQDTWVVNDNLSLTYGVRVNIPKANKAPPTTPGFEEAFGYRNDYRLGASNKVVLPRAAFNYTFDTERYSQLRGGIGLFQSVPPFVWLANPYQNNGVTAASFTSYDPSQYPFSPDSNNQPFPPNMTADGVAKQVDTIDPDFKLPTVWKVSLGYDAELPWMGLIGSVEAQHIKNKDGVFYQAINIGEVQGQLADGRDYYYCNLGSISSSNKNCGRNTAFEYNSTKLGNTDKGSSTAVTFSLNKPLANGWYGNLSYTYTKATEVGSDNSSQAWSGYQFVSRLNPNEEIASTASREVRNSIKASFGWEHAFFGDYKTSFTAFYNGRDGLPYTWIIDGDPNGDRIFQDPAYIPLVNDPNVSYGNATAEQIAAFHAFIDANPYLSSHRGQIAKRNGARYPWVNQFDVSLQQELPGFFKEHKSIIRLDIFNVLNMLNKDWGVTEQQSQGYDTRYLAGLAGIKTDGTYEYRLGNQYPEKLATYDSNTGYPHRVVSRWSALLTLRYEF